jgi:hypothetical protein
VVTRPTFRSDGSMPAPAPPTQCSPCRCGPSPNQVTDAVDRPCAGGPGVALMGVVWSPPMRGK